MRGDLDPDLRFGYFSKFVSVDIDRFLVVEHEVHLLDGGRHDAYEVVADRFEDELSRCLLRETVPKEGGVRKRWTRTAKLRDQNRLSKESRTKPHPHSQS